MQEPSLPVPAVTIPPGRREARPRADAGPRSPPRGGVALRCLHAVRGRVGPILSRHWLFATFLVVGVGLRVVASIAYWPGLEL
jgi:hypothetical protein